MDGLDLNRVRQEILTEYNINLSEDDPILVFLASHELILRQYNEHIKTAIAQGLEHYETTALTRNAKLLEGANDTANKILENALSKSLKIIEDSKLAEQELARTESSNGAYVLILLAVNALFTLGIFSYLMFN